MILESRGMQTLHVDMAGRPVLRSAPMPPSDLFPIAPEMPDRSHTISIRVSQGEKDVLERLRSQHGLASVGDVVRWALQRACTPTAGSDAAA